MGQWDSTLLMMTLTFDMTPVGIVIHSLFGRTTDRYLDDTAAAQRC